MKKISFLILVLFLISFVLPGCRSKDTEISQEIDAENVPKSPFVEQYGEYKPQMWVVEKDNHKIFLFGSIHVGVDGMYPLPDALTDAFNNSSVLAVENDIIELANDKEYLAAMLSIFMDKKSIKSSLSEEELTSMKNLLKEYGFDVDNSPNFKPTFFQTMIPVLLLEGSKYKTEHGVDRHFLEKAKNKGMKIKDIEDPLYVYTYLSALPNKTQVFLLNDTVKLYQDKEAREKETEDLYKSWVKGTLDQFLEKYNEEAKNRYTQEELAYYEEYNQVLEYDRNIIMTDKVIEYLDSGDVHFYVVGAAHYYGDRGILALLKEKGYEAKEITY